MKLPDVPFTAAQASGMAPADLRRLLRSGALRRPFRGVYCPADLPDTLEVRALCAAAVLPPHVVLADRSAAWLHGVDCLQYAETRLLPRLEVVSTKASPTRRRGAYGGQRQLRPDEIMRVHEVPVTTPVRTAIDLACLRGGEQALASVEALMRTCELTAADLSRQLVRHKGRRGVIQARSVVEIASSQSESQGESWTKWCIQAAGLPLPQAQVTLDVDGWGEVRLDFGYPEWRIAVEYDGVEFHGPRHRRRDRARRKALRAIGWKIIVVRADDLAPASREAWLGELRMAIAERAPNHRRTFPPKQRAS